MSQTSSNTSLHSSSLTCSCPPKKFLKKGEGLKRFAAYKPPLPMTASKLGRRQTFVKFKLHDKNQPTFIPPQILNDESINLSTEIPKIAPPKIMHTPIRPNRQALGAIRPATLNVCDEYDSDEHYFATPHTYPRGHENGLSTDNAKSTTDSSDKRMPQALLEKNLSRKIATITPTGPNKMISFNGFRKPATPSPRPSPSPVAQPPKASPVSRSKEPARRYNLRGGKKAGGDEPPVQKRETRRAKRQIKAIVERHISPHHSEHEHEDQEKIPEYSESQIKGNIDNLLHRIEKRKEALEEDRSPINIQPAKVAANLRVSDLSSPSPGNCILALGLQIQQIESTVNELRERIKNCECGKLLSPSEAPSKKSTRKTTRSKASTTSTTTRPSAYADNNTTPKILTCLVEEVSQLKARLDEMSLRQPLNTLTGNKAHQ